MPAILSPSRAQASRRAGDLHGRRRSAQRLPTSTIQLPAQPAPRPATSGWRPRSSCRESTHPVLPATRWHQARRSEAPGAPTAMLQRYCRSSCSPSPDWQASRRSSRANVSPGWASSPSPRSHWRSAPPTPHAAATESRPRPIASTASASGVRSRLQVRTAQSHQRATASQASGAG